MQLFLLWVAALLVLVAFTMNGKTLYIITGPPGSGKTTYATALGHPIYDHDLKNKHEWKNSKVSASLTTFAPSSKIKQHWVLEARKAGFTPVIVVMWLPRMETLDRMKARSGKHPTQQNRLDKEVERWYQQYSRHPQEERMTLAQK